MQKGKPTCKTIELISIHFLPSKTESSVTPLYAQSQAALMPSDAYLQKNNKNKLCNIAVVMWIMVWMDGDQELLYI